MLLLFRSRETMTGAPKVSPADRSHDDLVAPLLSVLPASRHESRPNPVLRSYRPKNLGCNYQSEEEGERYCRNQRVNARESHMPGCRSSIPGRYWHMHACAESYSRIKDKPARDVVVGSSSGNMWLGVHVTCRTSDLGHKHPTEMQLPLKVVVTR